MAFGIATVILAVLFFGFIALTGFEYKRGKRIFESSRTALDQHVAHAAVQVTTREHRAAFFARMLSFVSHVAHEMIHTILVSVRAFERMLTRLAKRLRAGRQVPPVAPSEGVVESRGE